MSTTCPLGLYFNAVTIPLINLYTQKHKIANRTTKPLIVHRETETMSSPQGSGGDIQQTPIMIEHLKNYKKCHHRKPARLFVVSFGTDIQGPDSTVDSSKTDMSHS